MERWLPMVMVVVSSGCGDSSTPVLVDASPPDQGPLPDAVSPALACASDPVPTAGAASYAITGAVRNFVDDVPLAAASVDLQHAGTSLGVFTTDSAGQFMTTVTTGSMPYELEERVTASGHVATHVFTPGPFTGMSLIRVALFDTTRLDAMATSAQITRDPAKGTLVVIAIDCTGMRYAGARFQVSPPGAAISYLDPSRQPSPTLTATSSDGSAVVWNVPPGPVTVTVTAENITWRPRTATVAAGEMSMAFRRP